MFLKQAWPGDLPPPIGARLNRDYCLTQIGIVRALCPNANPIGDAYVRDLTGFVGNASFVSGASWSRDTSYPIIVAYCRGGATNNHLQFSAPFNQNKAGQTWYLRMRYLGATSGQNSVLIAYDNGAGGIGRIVLGVADSANNGGPYGIYSTLDNGTSHATPGVIVPGGFYDVALTYDGTTAIAYVNGVAKGSFTPTINALTTPANVWIGAYTNAAASANIEIIECLVFNRWLPASAIWDLYNPATRARRYYLPRPYPSFDSALRTISVLSYTMTLPGANAFSQNKSGLTAGVTSYVYPGAVQPDAHATVLSADETLQSFGMGFPQNKSGMTTGVRSYLYPGAVQPKPPTISTASLVGRITGMAKAFLTNTSTPVVALVGQIKGMATLALSGKFTTALSGSVTGQAKASGPLSFFTAITGRIRGMAKAKLSTPSLATSLTGKASTKGKASLSGTFSTKLTGRATGMAKVPAGPISFFTFLAGRVSTGARAVLSIPSMSAKIAGKISGQAKASSQGKFSTALSGRASTSGKAPAGPISFLTFLSGRVTSMAKARLSTPSMVVGLAGRISTQAKGAVSFTFISGLALFGRITGMARAWLSSAPPVSGIISIIDETLTFPDITGESVTASSITNEAMSFPDITNETIQ